MKPSENLCSMAQKHIYAREMLTALGFTCVKRTSTENLTRFDTEDWEKEGVLVKIREGGLAYSFSTRVYDDIKLKLGSTNVNYNSKDKIEKYFLKATERLKAALSNEAYMAQRTTELKVKFPGAMVSWPWGSKGEYCEVTYKDLPFTFHRDCSVAARVSIRESEVEALVSLVQASKIK